MFLTEEQALNYVDRGQLQRLKEANHIACLTQETPHGTALFMRAGTGYELLGPLKKEE
jgi:hypothetical protein